MNDTLLQMKAIILNALQEDIGDGDITTLATISAETTAEGTFWAKESGVIAGLEVVRLTFALLDDLVRFTPHVTDGDWVAKGQSLASITGPGRAILIGERVALNLLQRMSGIATLTRRFVEAVRGTGTVILDTRKTAPGLRVLDKWSVRLGGGQNHRCGLYDMVLIKDNHIAAVGSIAEAVTRVRAMDTRKRAIEVEVKNLAELQEALTLQVDRIMLDNMTPADMREAVRLTNKRIPLEASGNVTLENVAAIAATGVDYISIGMLTHSVKGLDISLLLSNKVAGSK
jgi:nicotinate-nucleotide pyrophosphorylase (carboxylating)